MQTYWLISGDFNVVSFVNDIMNGVVLTQLEMTGYDQFLTEIIMPS